MTALSIIINIVLILVSIVLIVAVLMQQGQRQGLGAIGGGAETFFGKNKAKSVEGKLATITKIAAVVFIVLAIVTTSVTAHNPANQNDTTVALEELQAALEAADLEGVEIVEGEEEAAADEAADTTEEAAPAEEAADTTEEAAPAEEAADTTEEATPAA